MNNFTKIIMLISTMVLVIGGGAAAYLTFQSYQPISLISSNEQGIAIDGFDVVAYHKDGAARMGKENFQVTWAGSLWYFSTLENRQAFSQAPDRYAPQYGGYDPYALSINGVTQPATPELWAIHDNKLFLFYSGKTRKLWQENKIENIKIADREWVKIRQQIDYHLQMEKEPSSTGGRTY